MADNLNNQQICKEKLIIAVCEVTSTNSINENLKNVYEFLLTVPTDQNIDIISLPENTFFIRLGDGEEVQYLKLDNPFLDKYREYAVKNNVLLHIGATPLEIENTFYNATILIYPDGRIEVPYRKIHLFDIQLEDRPAIRESDIFQHGQMPSIIDYYGWKLGFTICYDIRFSELFLYYQLNDVDMVFIPSAFLVETGKVHWEILNRARAIESQCYIVSAAQGGSHSETRKTFGQSIVVSPWGDVLFKSQLDVRPHYHMVELHKSEVQRVRKQIPMKDHRRIPVSFKL